MGQPKHNHEACEACTQVYNAMAADARAEERELCAAIVEGWAVHIGISTLGGTPRERALTNVLADISAVIRKRP